MIEAGETRLMRFMLPLALLTIASVVILAFWSWMGEPIGVPTDIGTITDKSFCLSYAPYRGMESQMAPGPDIPASRIDDDMQRLSTLTRCVRTYQADRGLQNVPAFAVKYGMKVQQGIWIGRDKAENQRQIDAALLLVRQYPSIESVIVGSEVLLRGDQEAGALIDLIRQVKAKTSVPVTYADVWPIWETHSGLATVTDFVTIHVLPYWDNVEASHAATHVLNATQRIQGQFLGKRVVIGDVAWPSQGRMRGVAEASPSNQARVVRDVVALAEQHGLDITLEAFDQPWKRNIEGNVGGYWGLLDSQTREMKFPWEGPVSNHPRWQKQAAGGMLMAVLVFGIAFATANRHLSAKALLGRWAYVTFIAIVAGMTVDLMFERIPRDSFNIARYSFSLEMSVVALGSTICAVLAVMRGRRVLAFAEVFDVAPARPRDTIELACGIVLLFVTLLAVCTSLSLLWVGAGDFSAASVTAAVAPFALLALRSKTSEASQTAELIFAGLLFVLVAMLCRHESLKNWEFVWLCLALLTLALVLAQTSLRRLAGTAARSLTHASGRGAVP